MIALVDIRTARLWTKELSVNIAAARSPISPDE